MSARTVQDFNVFTDKMQIDNLSNNGILHEPGFHKPVSTAGRSRSALNRIVLAVILKGDVKVYERLLHGKILLFPQ